MHKQREDTQKKVDRLMQVLPRRSSVFIDARVILSLAGAVDCPELILCENEADKPAGTTGLFLESIFEKQGREVRERENWELCFCRATFFRSCGHADNFLLLLENITCRHLNPLCLSFPPQHSGSQECCKRPHITSQNCLLVDCTMCD